MTTPDYDFVDHERLLADLKAENGAAVAWAYRHVFGGETGRLVLTHQLARAGVGMIRGPAMDPTEARYHDGRGDHALEILNLAGFGPMSAAHAVAADVLKGQEHDRHDDGRDDDDGSPGPGGFGGPDEDPGIPG